MLPFFSVQFLSLLTRWHTREAERPSEAPAIAGLKVDADHPLASLQAASCIYRVALGPRAGQKALSLRTVPGRDEETTLARCAEA